jgi:autotransporter translocation and assembly factor TamB
MSFSRTTHRWFSGCLISTLLFMQLAVAAYVCLVVTLEGTQTTADMSDCRWIAMRTSASSVEWGGRVDVGRWGRGREGNSQSTLMLELRIASPWLQIAAVRSGPNLKNVRKTPENRSKPQTKKATSAGRLF